MRETRRIMDREIQKGSTPLKYEKLFLDNDSYQEIANEEKLLEVLRYLHRIDEYRALASKMVINNVYTYMRGKTPDFKRARSLFDRQALYRQMVKRGRKMQPTFFGDCYIETVKCYFSLPDDEWESHRMKYKEGEAFGFIMSDKYILGLYKFCREARLDMAFSHDIKQNEVSALAYRLMSLKDVSVLAHCLLLDDVWTEDCLIGAKLYTIFVLE
jgi:hypothetical protein